MSFENEDVNLSESSAEETNEQQTDSNDAPAEEAAPAAKSEDNVPFHMHPRFQEVISEKNALKEQTAAFQRELAELRTQIKSSTPAEKDELMERLESIDPKFAGLLRNMRDELKSTKQQLEDFSSWRQQSSQETVQERVGNLKSQFYTENKIPEDRKAIYEAMVQAEAGRNPKLKVSDLPGVLKQVHESLGKMFQTVERDTTKKFVADKKSEASKPAPLAKGAPAKATKPEQNLSHSQLKAQMLREAMDDVKSSKEI
jgi:hypothetical protein